MTDKLAVLTDPRRQAFTQMVDTSRLVRTYVDTRARQIGTTRAQWALLSRLVVQPGLTQAELAEILEIQPISLTRLVDRMAEQKLVERQPHPTDRRANCVFITETGLLAMEAFAPLAADITDELFDGIDETMLTVFRTVLDRLKSNAKARLADQRDVTSQREAVHYAR